MSNQDRVVIVTGGSRGLGFALVEDLLQVDYRVATCSRSHTHGMDALFQRHSRDHFFWKSCCIGDAKEEASFVDAVVDWAKGSAIYALVNNAGIASDGVLATFSEKDLAAILEINLAGSLRLSRLIMRQLLRQASIGRIINISSIVGLRGYSGLAAYSATKAGLDGLTRALAREVGRRGITVNSVAPGFLETELSDTLDARQRQQIIRRTPLRRLGCVKDITPLIRYLLSEEASFVTGQTWVIDGGLSC